MFIVTIVIIFFYSVFLSTHVLQSAKVLYPLISYSYFYIATSSIHQSLILDLNLAISESKERPFLNSFNTFAITLARPGAAPFFGAETHLAHTSSLGISLHHHQVLLVLYFCHWRIFLCCTVFGTVTRLNCHRLYNASVFLLLNLLWHRQ